MELPQSLAAECVFPNFHARSGPLFPPDAISSKCFGGGRGGGTGSLEFGIDIGIADVAGEDVELYELDLLEDRK
jgi:hypothetical protein